MVSETHNDKDSAGGRGWGRMLRLREVLEFIPVSRSTLYDGIKDGRFPAPMKNGRISLWRSEDVAGWLADPANSGLVPNRDLARLAEKSRIFQSDVKLLMSISRQIEIMSLAILQQGYESRRTTVSPNAYDRACLDKLKQRIKKLQAGNPPSMDILAYWQT